MKILYRLSIVLFLLVKEMQIKALKYCFFTYEIEDMLTKTLLHRS